MLSAKRDTKAVTCFAHQVLKATHIQLATRKFSSQKTPIRLTFAELWEYGAIAHNSKGVVISPMGLNPLDRILSRFPGF